MLTPMLPLTLELSECHELSQTVLENDRSYSSTTVRCLLPHCALKHYLPEHFLVQWGSSLGNHSGDEILVADLSVGADIDLADPLVKLGRLELLADASEDVAEFGDGDKSRGVLVEDLEGVAKLVIERLRLHVLGHQVQELREIERRREILLGDDGFELRMGRVPAEGSHKDPELRRRDPTVTVNVEEREGLIHGRNMVVTLILAHRPMETSPSPTSPSPSSAPPPLPPTTHPSSPPHPSSSIAPPPNGDRR
ncbi:hypothetical protein L484_026538 [Morus notabilis]|uniref:Uncharacterized protein n=1 Tax=Morus notabilis TaxID=981085 RepID=W9QNW8_9ROSA|nr:hypothetical protein L484_026538 [Morus notabilis]